MQLFDCGAGKHESKTYLFAYTPYIWRIYGVYTSTQKVYLSVYKRVHFRNQRKARHCRALPYICNHAPYPDHFGICFCIYAGLTSYVQIITTRLMGGYDLN